MYLNYVEADVLVEGEESDNSKTVIVPNAMNQEKLDQESKLGEWEWKYCQRHTHTCTHSVSHTCTHAFTHKHARMCTRAHTHTHTHTHTFKLTASETYLSNSVVRSQSSLQPFSATDTNTNMSSLHYKSHISIRISGIILYQISSIT